MRIVIQIDEGRATVTTDTAPPGPGGVAGAEPRAGLGGLGTGEAIDAGPPAEGVPLGAPADAAVSGQAIDAGTAPSGAGAAVSELGGIGTAEGSEGEPVDAGSAPDRE